MPTPCHDFSAVSAYIHDWIRGQPSVKEESTTDWLLHELSKRRPEVAYRAWTRHEESNLGADWWWVLLFSRGTMFFHVQAKKLTATNGNNYRGLAHPKMSCGQISKLLKTSSAVGAMPLYAFYSGRPSTGLCVQGKGADEGVYLASARKVDALMTRSSMVRSRDLLAMSIPLSCLVCCPLTENKDIAGYRRLLSRYFWEGEKDSQSGYSEGISPSVDVLLRAAWGDAREPDSERDGGESDVPPKFFETSEDEVPIYRILVSDMRTRG